MRKMRKIALIVLGGVIMALSILSAGCTGTGEPKVTDNNGKNTQYFLPRETTAEYTSVISTPGKRLTEKLSVSTIMEITMGHCL